MDEAAFDTFPYPSVVAGPENRAEDLMSPCILDKVQKQGNLIYGMSSSLSGDMSLGGAGVDLAFRRRQAFIDDLLKKYGYQQGSVDVKKAVYMLPNMQEPVVVGATGEKQIITGPEAVLFKEPVTVIMQPKDCPPVFLYDTKNNAAAFLHGSYHAADRRDPIAAIEMMKKEFNTNPDDLTAYVGPGVGPGWFRRRYLVTKNPEIWRESLDTWDDKTQVIERRVFTADGEYTIFFPDNNKFLKRICGDRGLSLRVSSKVTDAIDFLLNKFKKEVPQMSINLQKVLVGELMSAGIRPENLEVDKADTVQNSRRGLMYSYQAEYRHEAKLAGNPIAIFGIIR